MTDTPQVLLAHHLKVLKLPTFLREYDKLARQCAAEGVDHVRYLVRLTELELIDRERRMVERRIRQAKFPVVKSLDAFDFKAIPSLNKMRVLELARCEYVERRENVIALGNTHPHKERRDKPMQHVQDSHSRLLILGETISFRSDGPSRA
jgi:DNA replication protein DnaC